MVKLVGILNVTPDSFSDGGQYNSPELAISHAGQLFDEGADLVDVGAESTRPNARPLSPEEEWQRLEPILPVLLSKYPGKISLDTRHPEVVKKAFGIGSAIINDVTGMNNPAMVEAVTDLKAPVVISHLPGIDIQTAHREMPVDNIERVKRDLLDRASVLRQKGLAKENIILDPGIGFGKTMELNRQLLGFARLVPDYPVMVGYSRKRFLGENRMQIGPNLEAARITIAAGTEYLRVHDVKAHSELLETLET